MSLHSTLSTLAASFELYCFTTWPELCFAFIFLLLSLTWYRKHKNTVMIQWPVLGILPSLLQNAHRVHDWTVEIANTFGGTILRKGLVFVPAEILFTCDPQNVEHIVRTNFANYPKGTDYNNTFEILGEGLFNVDSKSWQKQRSMARAVITSKKFRENLANVTKRMLKDSLLPLLSHMAKESSIVDLEDVFMRYAFDNSFLIIFGKNPKYLNINLPDNEFERAMEDGLEAVFYRHILPRPIWKLCNWLKIGKERKLEQAWKTIDLHVEKYIAEKKEELLEGKEENDLLETYMNFLKDEDCPFDLLSKGDKFLRDTTLSFLFAGKDTTGTGLSWFFWFVCKDPRVEAKILEELTLVYYSKTNAEKGIITSSSWLLFDIEDIKQMIYLHAAICESLRLYPPLPLNRKSPLRKDVLPDGTVTKPGMMIVISMFAMARMEWIWGKNCLEFRPERWIDEHGRLSHEAMSKFFSFSAGPRACLGKNIAFTLMKMAAAAVIFNFHVELVEGQIVEPKSSLVIRMKNGLKVRVKERVSY